MVITTGWLARVLVALAAWDRLHAEEVRRGGCPHCQGPLHAGHYQRKPWGWPRADPRQPLAPQATLRWSWCCGRRGCRKRLTPQSWRFHGRRFYVAPLVVALTAIATGLQAECPDWEQPSPPTRRRWLAWWRDTFAASARWVDLRGRLDRGLTVSRLPGGLAEGSAVRRPLRLLIGGLALVRPWTGGAAVR